MKFSFIAEIYKVGINPCVTVPIRITKKMRATKGYISVKGKINGHSFVQTLVPVKNAAYRLYVNGLMLKGSATKTGDTAKFIIEQNFDPPTVDKISMLNAFKKALAENSLLESFKQLIPSRRKEILRYLNHLKTEEALIKNISKLISQLKEKKKAEAELVLGNRKRLRKKVDL